MDRCPQNWVTPYRCHLWVQPPLQEPARGRHVAVWVGLAWRFHPASPPTQRSKCVPQELGQGVQLWFPRWGEEWLGHQGAITLQVSPWLGGCWGLCHRVRSHSPIEGVLVGIGHVHDVDEAAVPCREKDWGMEGKEGVQPAVVPHPPPASSLQPVLTCRTCHNGFELPFVSGEKQRGAVRWLGLHLGPVAPPASVPLSLGAQPQSRSGWGGDTHTVL